MSRERDKLVTEQSIAPRWRWTALPAATRQRRLPLLPHRPPVNARSPRAETSSHQLASRRLSRRSGRANGIRHLRRKCLRHREAQGEARRRRALLLSGALRLPSGQPKHGVPMVNTASFPSGGALVVRGARGGGLRGEARAKNTHSSIEFMP